MAELEDVAEGEEGVDEDAEEGEGEGDSDDAAAAANVGGDLQRGMEGERMVKSGFLYKKQERRKVSRCTATWFSVPS